MALSSMTGFARAEGTHGSYRWAWELKSVNAKGLEVRLRLPPGWDSVELPVRARAAVALRAGIRSRGRGGGGRPGRGRPERPTRTWGLPVKVAVRSCA